MRLGAVGERCAPSQRGRSHSLCCEWQAWLERGVGRAVAQLPIVL